MIHLAQGSSADEPTPDTNQPETKASEHTNQASSSSTDTETPSSEEHPTYNVYVTDLSPDITDADLEAAFASFGPVDSTQVVMDRATGLSKRFGFVNFTTDKARDQAVSSRSFTVKVRSLSPGTGVVCACVSVCVHCLMPSIACRARQFVSSPPTARIHSLSVIFLLPCPRPNARLWWSATLGFPCKVLS